MKLIRYLLLAYTIHAPMPQLFAAQQNPHQKNVHRRDEETQGPNRRQKIEAEQTHPTFMTEQVGNLNFNPMQIEPVGNINAITNQNNTTTSSSSQPMEDIDEKLQTNDTEIKANEAAAKQIFELAHNKQTEATVATLERLLNDNPYINLNQYKDEDGNTALMLLIRNYTSGESNQQESSTSLNVTNRESEEIENLLYPDLSLFGLDPAEFHPPLKAIYLLLKAGADVNARNDEGFTPLLIAVQNVEKGPEHYDIKLIRLLLAYGADIKAKNLENKSVIDFVLDDAREITKELLQKGAPVNYSDVSLFLEAAKWGNMALVQAFLNHGMNIEIEGKWGLTALQSAAGSYHPNIDMIKELIARGADVNHINPASGLPALWNHIFNNIWDIPESQMRNAQVVQLLVDAGTNVNLQNPDALRTALMEFIYRIESEGREGIKFNNNDIEIIRALLRGNKKFGPTNPALKDAKGKTLADYLRIKPEDTKRIKRFKQAVIKEIEEYNKEAKNALHREVTQGLSEVLLRDLQPFVTAYAEEPISLATAQGESEEKETKEKESAAQNVVMHAEPTFSQRAPSADEVARNNLNSALFKAINYQATREQIIDLLNRGAELNAQDNFGYTPLILAVIHNRQDIVDLLLERINRQVNPRNFLDIKDKTGDTALDWAERLHRKEIRLKLIGAGASTRS